MIIMVSDVLSVYNVYGPSAALVTSDAEVEPGQLGEVVDAEALAQAVQADTGYCASDLVDVTSTYTPFPGQGEDA